MSLNPSQTAANGAVSGSILDFSSREFFVMIGAMKAGTTSLAQYLGRHPKIFMSSRKEPKFFSRDEFYGRGLEWYSDLFAGATEDQVLGEASTCYSRHAKYPRAADRLHQHLPHARLLYVLRHPVERLYSHYVFTMQRPLESGEQPARVSFEEFVRQDEEALDAGDYMAQIDCYLRLFDVSRLKCLLYDDLFGSSTNVAAEVFDFLGVEQTDLGDPSQVHENKRGSAFAKLEVDTTITRFRQSFPAKHVIDLLPVGMRSSLRSTAVKILCSTAYGRRHANRFAEALPKLTPADRRSLCEHYHPSVLKLEEFLGRRLPQWME